MTPKAQAKAEQAAREKQQATLDRILRAVLKMMDKMGLKEDEQPEPELPGEIRRRRQGEQQGEPAEQPRAIAQTVPPPPDTRAEAERMKQQTRRNK